MNKYFFQIIIIFPFWTISQQYKPTLDSILKSYTQEGFGMTTLISKNGIVEYEATFGSANIELNVPLLPEHKFQIGSITKQFTAVLILKLVEEGKINLNDSIQQYIPLFPNKGKTIRIKHLLTHTSGLPEYMDWEENHELWANYFTPDELLNLIKNKPLNFEPGDDFEYTNSSYLILGLIIENITDTPYTTYLKSEIFDKIGMNNTYSDYTKTDFNTITYGYTRTNDQIKKADYTDRSWLYSAGNIISTINDLNKWYMNLFDGKIISKSTLKKATNSFKLNNGSKTQYGYGWYVNELQKEKMIYHGGSVSGFYSTVNFLPKTKTLTVTLSNCDCIPIEYIGQKITSYAMGKPLYEKKIIELKPEDLERYVGKYKVGESRIFFVKRKNGQLYGYFEETPDEGYNLYAEKEGVFFSPDIDCSFEFLIDGKEVKIQIKIPSSDHGKQTVSLLPKIN